MNRLRLAFRILLAGRDFLGTAARDAPGAPHRSLLRNNKESPSLAGRRDTALWNGSGASGPFPKHPCYPLRPRCQSERRFASLGADQTSGHIVDRAPEKETD